MRKSHFIFFGACAAWVSFVVLHPGTQPFIEEEGIAVVLGNTMAELTVPAVLYGAYLLIMRRKATQKKNSNPVGSKE